MNILFLFPLIPLLMMLGLWVSRSTRQIHAVMVAGSSLLLLLAVVLVFRFLALREAGVDMGKVKIMDMAPGEALAPFIRGDIDAAYIWEPGLGLVVQNGGKILLTSEQMAEKGHLTWDVISVQPEFARKYPELVTKFIKSELAAMEYWREHPEEAAKIIAKELGGISVGDAERMMAGTRLIGLDEQLSPAFLGTSAHKGRSAGDIINVAAFLLEQGRIKNEVPRQKAEDFLHPEFLEALRDGRNIK